MKRVLQAENSRVLFGVSALCLLAMALSMADAARGLWPFDGDAISFFAPWRMWAGESLRQGILPLWNPHLFGGIPFLSNGQTGALYPPNIVYTLLPIRAAMLSDAIFHSVLLGCGGYLLARTLNRSRAASWLCAICLMLGGGVASHLFAGHLTWHATRAFLPLLVWALWNALSCGQRKYFIAFALLYALQIFAGHPPYAIWNTCWCLVFVALWFWSHRSKTVFSARHFALMGVLIALLCAAAVLPVGETSRLSAHGNALSFEHATMSSATLAGWVRLALPNFFGGNSGEQWSISEYPHEEAAYIGLIPFLLAMFAPLLWRWCRRDAPEVSAQESSFDALRFVNALWLILPIALLLALGKNAPFYQWVYDALPPFRMFRVPARWFEIWYFAAAVLAAFGLDACLNLSAARLRKVSAALFIFALLLVGAAIVLGALAPDSAFWLQSVQWNKSEWEIERAALLDVAQALRLAALQSVVMAAATLLLGLYILRRLQSTSGAGRRVWVKAIVALIAFDVLIVFWTTATPADDLPPRNPWLRGVEKYYSAGDRWNTAFEGAAFSYGLNRGLPRNIDILGGYDTLIPQNFFEFAAAVEGREFWSSQYQAQKIDPLLRVAGITHFLASANSPRISELSASGAKLVAKFGQGETEMQLWQLPTAWPRVFLATEVLRAPRERQLTLLREAAARSTPVAVVDEAAFFNLPSRVVSPGRVLQWRRPANMTMVEVETSASQILVLSESYSPGWRAWVNGKQTQIERANFLFRGVEVPPGKSRVVFVYDKQTLRFGLFLSLLGLSAAAGVLMASRRLR